MNKLVHTDYDSDNRVKLNVDISSSISSISFAYDRGRLYISVNGDEVYDTSIGTDDCLIEIYKA